MKASSSSNQNSGNNTGAEVSSGSKLKKLKGGVATKTLANKTGRKKGPSKKGGIMRGKDELAVFFFALTSILRLC